MSEVEWLLTRDAHKEVALPDDRGDRLPLGQKRPDQNPLPPGAGTSPQRERGRIGGGRRVGVVGDGVGPNDRDRPREIRVWSGLVPQRISSPRERASVPPVSAVVSTTRNEPVATRLPVHDTDSPRRYEFEHAPIGHGP
jgi:hypothetical protein